jgi:nucleoside-diphosphate-sugar epimerase
VKIFLIGGTGFVGSRLLSRLIQYHTVTVLTRSAQRAEGLNQQGILTLVGDLDQLAALSGQVDKQDLVVYLAMPPVKMGRNSKNEIGRLSSIIRDHLLNTVGFVRKHRCPVIFTLGTSYRTKNGEVADESWPIQRFGMTLAGSYFDTLIEELGKEGEIQVIQAIPGQIYGPGGLFMKILRMASKKTFVIFGDGLNRIPRIHVDDLVEGYLRIIQKLPVGERFIFADDYPCTTHEFNALLYELIHGKLKEPLKIPAWILRLLLGSYVTDTLMMDCVVSNEKAKKLLGWDLKYPTYREGLPATLEAYRKGLS